MASSCACTRPGACAPAPFCPCPAARAPSRPAPPWRTPAAKRRYRKTAASPSRSAPSSLKHSALSSHNKQNTGTTQNEVPVFFALRPVMRWACRLRHHRKQLFPTGITYLLYYIAPRRQSGAAELEKIMEGRCFSPNRAKAGRRENKFFQNPTFAFMHNILLSYLGKPLHFFPSSCLFTVDNAKNAIEQHQNKQNSSRACGAENAILKPQKWGPPAVNLW